MVFAYFIAGKRSNIPVAFLAMYSIRAMFLKSIYLPLPNFYMFQNPDFPSLFVDYQRQSDLYFSGHTGCMMMLTVDSYIRQTKLSFILALSILLFTIYVLIVEGIHYSNDILIGLCASTLIARMCYRYRYNFNIALMKVLAYPFRNKRNLKESILTIRD